MKPALSSLAIVTATLDPLRATPCFHSWMRHSRYALPVYMVWSRLSERHETPALTQAVTGVFEGAAHLTIINRVGGGVVPAFASGVESAFADGAEMVLAIHDDVLIEEPDWDVTVKLAMHGSQGFAGFGGATGAGAADIYQTPYNPMQLARSGFVSNMRDAEAHGRRSTERVPCVCFDGFSQVGTADWFGEAWKTLDRLGLVHHAYDLALGCLARRAGKRGVMLPVKVHHFGGMTAVGDPNYQAWAKTQTPAGDQGFWEQAHRIVFEEFKDCLPLRLIQ